MTTREIITLQFGHYSNYVGTHFWNTQEAQFQYAAATPATPATVAATPKQTNPVNHDVLFRTGFASSSDSSSQGFETYTPRLLAFDLKGSLNSLNRYGSLYGGSSASESQVAWSGAVQHIQQERAVRNEFLEHLHQQDEAILREDYSSARAPRRPVFDLDGSVAYWSDYCKIHIHPRTVHLTRQYTHQSDIEPFDIYSYGQAVWKDRDFADSVDTDLHFFAEECDSLQGFHALVDVTGGFGGLAASMLTEIMDDYSSKPLLTLGLSPADDRFGTQDQLRSGTRRALNETLATSVLREISSVFVPVSDKFLANAVPGLTVNPKSWYHTSAIMAAAFDTATLPYRLATPKYSLNEVSAALTFGSSSGRIASLSACVPFPHDFTGKPASELFSQESFKSSQPQMFTPLLAPVGEIRSQSWTLRGVQSYLSAADIENIERCMARPGCLSLPAIISTAFPIQEPFPVSVFGYGSSSSEAVPHSLPTLSLLQAGSRVTSGVVKSILFPLRKESNVDRQMHMYEDSGMSSDEISNARELLLELVDNDEEYID